MSKAKEILGIEVGFKMQPDRSHWSIDLQAVEFFFDDEEKITSRHYGEMSYLRSSIAGTKDNLIKDGSRYLGFYGFNAGWEIRFEYCGSITLRDARRISSMGDKWMKREWALQLKYGHTREIGYRIKRILLASGVQYVRTTFDIPESRSESWSSYGWKKAKDGICWVASSTVSHAREQIQEVYPEVWEPKTEAAS